MKPSITSTLRTLLPSSSDYRELRTSWRKDLLAGVTVGIVALPLALAFGVSSGVGAEAGLITAIIAGLVAAIFGGSNVQVSGPTGAMVVVLAPIVATQGIGHIAVVSILAGLIVLAAGALRLGRTVNYIPWPVIEGFTAGIGIIIFAQQIPSAVGIDAAGHSSNALTAAAQSIAEASWPNALLPLAAVAAVAAIMITVGALTDRIPSSFVAILAVSIAAVALGLPLAAIGELPHSLPTPIVPAFTLTEISSLLGPATAVALLASIESLLSARVASSMADTGEYNPDRELVGQGLASIASGMFGGMPATGAIARTAVNVRSGARTRLSAIVHALALLGVITAASTVVAAIPLAALAGVLMMTAARMISPRIVKQVLTSTRSDAAVFLVTAAITVSVDLVVAVGIGIAAAAFFALRALSAASGVHRQELPGAAQPGDGKIALFRVEGSLFFGAAERLLDRVSGYRGVEVVILRLSELQLLDATGAHTLTEMLTSLEQRDVTVLVSGVRSEHTHLLDALGILDALRTQDHLFTDLDLAAAHARAHIFWDDPDGVALSTSRE